ncbi:translocation/assembly module TamB domain-containing protein, partial [Chromatium okenii]|uniref:translocation/assembly module TamB domain-containing protein n=1 Tax=Chromatium okenii TaxID=61644 RepID=UPI0026E9A1E1
DQQLTLTALRVDALDGHFDGQATLALEPALNWTAQLTWSDLNPGVIAAEWPGRISGRLTTHGQLPTAATPNSVLEITTAIEQLTGTLRGYPLNAAGAVNLHGDNVQLNAVTAKVGSSSLRIDGTIATATTASDLVLALNAPDLAQVLPGASGRLTLNGQLRGLLTAPQFKFAVNANAVQIVEQRIGRLVGNGDLDLTAPGRFALQLDGQQLQLGGLAWTTLALRGDGTLPDHRLQITLTGKPQTLKLAANGALSANSSEYHGAVTTAIWQMPKYGQWQLQRPVQLDWAAPQLTLTPLCLQHSGGSRGCVTFAQQSAQNWSATLDVPRVETEVLAGLLPSTLRLKGALQFTGQAQAINGAVTGTLAAQWPTGLVHSGREDFEVSGTQLTAAITPSGLNAQLALPIKALGAIKAEMYLPGWRTNAPLRSEQPLRGRIQVQVAELARLAALLPEINRLRGAITGDVTIAGTLAQPSVRGEMQVQKVAFAVTALALDVTDLTLTATTPAPNRVQFNGQALLGGGQLALSGGAHWNQTNWQATLHASGKRLQLANTKAYFALVSPQVDVDIGATGATVRGEIQVPEARIRPRKLPAGTVSASPDIVLNTAPQQSPLPVTLDMRVVLGKEVTLDGFGMRGRLEGDVRVSQLPGKPLVGDGQLQIIDGQYQLSSALGLASAEWGSALTIRQGRLIFAKSPVDNPGLLLQAERDGGAVSAGVRVLGTLRTPKLAFFSDSDPNMTPAQMTKYLMTGIAPADGDRAQNTGLAIGTYLAPKIYAEYEAGFGHTPDKMRLRYDVSRQIEFETETGEQAGADLYFKFEN